jgi:hypothetical protein
MMKITYIEEHKRKRCASKLENGLYLLVLLLLCYLSQDV